MKIQKLAVMSLTDKVTYIFLVSIGFLLTLFFGMWWFNPSHIPFNFSGAYRFLDYLIFALLTYVVWYDILNQIFLWVISFSMKKPKPMEPKAGMKVAFLTAFVPGKEPLDLLEKNFKGHE